MMINNGESGLDVRTALNGALTGVFTPDMYGAHHSSGVDDTAAVLAARDAADANNAPLYFPRDVYRVSQTIDIPSNMGVIIPPGVQIRAQTGFVGSSVLRVGDPTSSDITQYVNIQGGGTIDVNNKCDMGVDFANAAFCRADKLRILGANLKGIRVGDPAAVNSSYEVDLSAIRVRQNDVANIVGSVGIAHEQATDCHVSDAYSIGYRTGFLVASTGGSIDYSLCHAWVKVVHGVMIRGFDLQGRRNSLHGCYADTPTNYGDPSLTDLSCFFVHGLNNTIVGGRAFMTTGGANGALATDGLVSIVKTDQEVNSSVYVMVGGSSASFRWKTRTEGSTRTLDAQFNDSGEFYSAQQSHNRTTYNAAFRPLVSTVSTLPSSVMRENCLAMVSDPAAGKGRLVYHDGTIWRYVSDDSAT